LKCTIHHTKFTRRGTGAGWTLKADALSRASPGAKRKGLETRRGASRGGDILFAEVPICFQIVRRCFSPPGAKPSSTSAVVLRPLFSSGVLQEGAFSSSPLARARGRSLRVHPPSFCAPVFPANRIGFVLAEFFGCTSVSCTGFFFDDRIITRKTRKSHRNTENIKNRLDGTHVVPSPAPTRNPRKSTEFTKRGTGAEEWKLYFFISGCGDATSARSVPRWRNPIC